MLAQNIDRLYSAAYRQTRSISTAPLTE